jgi:hypothetical protein
MKKIVFILLFGIIGINVSAQQHEVKVDVFDMIAFKSLDATYMYILNEESGVGASIFMPLSGKKNIFNYNEDFTFTPFYRQYFPLGPVENIFAEAFFALNSGEGFNDDDEFVKYTDGAFGFAVGKSYISPRGFVAEAFIGAGRNLFDSPGSPSFVPRIGVNLGFRF